MARFIRLFLPFLLIASACGKPAVPTTTTPPTSPTPPPPSAPGTPVAVAPRDGAYVTLRPTFVVLNAAHATPTSVALQYRFELATGAAFGNVLTTGTVPEGLNQTVFTPAVDLPAMTMIFWRAQAIDPTNDLRSGFGGGAFATPVVGSVTLTISTATPCDSFMTDLLVDGSATTTDAGLVFQTTDVGSMASKLTLNDSGGTATGDAWSIGQGTRCLPGDYPGMKVRLQYQSGVSASGVSFATAGRVSGNLVGGIKTWNVFSDGGATQQRNYSFSLVPR